jgi:hypothetical protein
MSEQEQHSAEGQEEKKTTEPTGSVEQEQHEKASEQSTENTTKEEVSEVKAAETESKNEEAYSPSDEELEAEDTHEDEVSSDEDSEEIVYQEEALEIPDYSSYSVDQLIAEAKKLPQEHPVQAIKEHMDGIRKHLLNHLNDERKAKLAEFLEAGGVEMDFEYIQPLREEFRHIYGAYRASRKKYYADLEARLKDNLTQKLALIERLKELVSKDETIGNTFKEFNELQQEWRNIGPVPRAESGDLWRTYHHHVDNFYEYVKINKELRDLDFKKNKESKESLIEQAEALLDLESLREAFSRLQNLHKKWKFIGPVEREDREPLWERFSATTKALHNKRDAYFEEQREKAEEKIKEKKSLVEKIKEFPLDKVKNHKQWQEAIKGVEAVRQAFIKIGRLNHPENDSVWEEFREVLRNFNHHKNNFYKEQKAAFQKNLDQKKALLDQAEALKDSEDWQEATNVFKRIQAEWKKVGHVPRSESDKIWKKFKAACNHYFERLSAHNAEKDAAFAGNLEQKQALLEEVKAFETGKDQKAAIQGLKGFINQWKQIGKVPRANMNIDQQFNKALDEKFKAIDLDKKESQRIRFENRMETLTGKDQGDAALRRERAALYSQKQEAEKELNQLENNMSFFSSSNKNNPLLKEAEKNIQKQRDHINDIAAKVKMLNIKIREVNKPAEDASETPETSAEDS